MEYITDQEIEVLQKKAKTRFIIVAILSVISFVLMLFAFGFDGEGSLFKRVIETVFVSIAILCAWVPILFFIIARKAYQRFNTAFKNSYVFNTIQSTNLFEDLSYDMNNGFDYDTICDSAVVNCGDSDFFSSEDMITGKYQDTEFQFCDVVTKQKVRRNKKTNIDTIFDGQILRFEVFDNLKTSDEYLQIFEKEFLSDIRGWTAEYKMETENEAFNTKFQIYASNEHNAFYILTPHLIEKILDFSQTAEAQISISFYDKVMFVAINRCNSMFDGKVDEPIDKQKEDIINDIKFLQKAGDILLCKHNDMLNNRV